MSSSPENRVYCDYPLVVLFGFVVLWPVGIFMVLPTLYYGYYLWGLTTQRGILVDTNDWPEPIQTLSAAIDSHNSHPPIIEVYLLDGQPAETLSTVVCRLPYSDESWEIIECMLDLQPVERIFCQDVSEQIFSKSDPTWWPPPEHVTTFYASQRLLAGSEADLYIASIDRTTDMIHIHYHFNF